MFYLKICRSTPLKMGSSTVGNGAQKPSPINLHWSGWNLSWICHDFPKVVGLGLHSKLYGELWFRPGCHKRIHCTSILRRCGLQSVQARMVSVPWRMMELEWDLVNCSSEVKSRKAEWCSKAIHCKTKELRLSMDFSEIPNRDVKQQWNPMHCTFFCLGWHHHMKPLKTAAQSWLSSFASWTVKPHTCHLW